MTTEFDPVNQISRNRTAEPFGVEGIDPLDRSHTAPKFMAPHPGVAAEWYRDQLSFPKIAIYNHGDYAIVGRGKLTLHLCKCADRSLAENTSCYVELETIELLDRLHAEWLAASSQHGFAPGRIEPEPKNQHGHGMREFHVWDPAGNLIGFGASLKAERRS